MTLPAFFDMEATPAPRHVPRSSRSRLVGEAAEDLTRQALPVRTPAAYDRDSKTVLCLSCAETAAASGPIADQAAVAIAAGISAMIVVHGVAGASLQREYERRSSRRELRIRASHPRIGGLLLAVTAEPQTTRAFREGAIGERVAVDQLTKRCDASVLLLVNRKLGAGRRDGVAITASGVRVIDVKR